MTQHSAPMQRSELASTFPAHVWAASKVLGPQLCFCASSTRSLMNSVLLYAETLFGVGHDPKECIITLASNARLGSCNA